MTDERAFHPISRWKGRKERLDACLLYLPRDYALCGFGKEGADGFLPQCISLSLCHRHRACCIAEESGTLASKIRLSSACSSALTSSPMNPHI